MSSSQYPLLAFHTSQDPSAYTETLFPHLLSVLPRGITLWHGLDDAILMNEGDRMTIQNLTWGGLQVRTHCSFISPTYLLTLDYFTGFPNAHQHSSCCKRLDCRCVPLGAQFDLPRD